jgi:hypothetical protein
MDTPSYVWSVHGNTDPKSQKEFLRHLDLLHTQLPDQGHEILPLLDANDPSRDLIRPYTCLLAPGSLLSIRRASPSVSCSPFILCSARILPSTSATFAFASEQSPSLPYRVALTVYDRSCLRQPWFASTISLRMLWSCACNVDPRQPFANRGVTCSSWDGVNELRVVRPQSTHRLVLDCIRIGSVLK